MNKKQISTLLAVLGIIGGIAFTIAAIYQFTQIF